MTGTNLAKTSFPPVRKYPTVFRTRGEVTLRRWDKFEEPQLRHGKGPLSWTPGGLGAIHNGGVLGRHRNQGALGRGKTRGVKYAVANVGDVLLAPIVAALILREDHMVQDRASLLPIDPQ